MRGSKAKLIRRLLDEHPLNPNKIQLPMGTIVGYASSMYRSCKKALRHRNVLFIKHILRVKEKSTSGQEQISGSAT